MIVEISKQWHTENRFCILYRVSDHGFENWTPPMTKEQMRDVANAINKFLGDNDE